MAITKEQKQTILEKAKKELGNSKSLIFADFTGTSVSQMAELRSKLLEVGAKFKVIKKRLLKVLLGEEKIDLDPLQFEGPLGTVFIDGDISDAAGPLYQFTKENENFKLLGAFNLEKGEEIDEETINAIGSLPPKDVLLGQVVGSIAAPLRGLVYVLSEKSKAQ